jgi:hypothetical protein
MAKFYLLLSSAAKPGRAEEYSEWCRTRHLPDLMGVPGVVGIKRYKDVGKVPEDGQVRFMTQFELECDDPKTVVAEFGRRMAAKEIDTSDCYDPASVKMQFTQLETEFGSMFQG